MDAFKALGSMDGKSVEAEGRLSQENNWSVIKLEVSKIFEQ